VRPVERRTQVLQLAIDAAQPLRRLVGKPEPLDVADVAQEVLRMAASQFLVVRIYTAARDWHEKRGLESLVPLNLRNLERQVFGWLDGAVRMPEFAAAAAKGRQMSQEEAIARALTASERIAPMST